MQIIDLAEQTRLLGQVAPALETLRSEAQKVREGQILAPVPEIAPAALRAQRLAAQCVEQLHTLSTSQYAAMKDGHPNLAQLVAACAQVSLAATLCTLAINSRTEILLYEDADPTPTAASRDHLRRACDEMDHAATTYRALAQRLSRRLASAAARREDQQRINRALVGPGAITPAAARAAATAPGPAASSPAPKRR